MALTIVRSTIPRNWRPDWVGEVAGRNYKNGPQLAGRRVIMTRPPAGIPFNPWEHVRDAGPMSNRKPQIILPGYGLADADELHDIREALSEKNEAGWMEEERAERPDINQRVRDYADWMLRMAKGRKTFGPSRSAR